MVARWLPCVGFPDYEVSDDGRVRNVATGRELSAATGANGYRHLALWRGQTGARRRVNVNVHVLVLEAFAGPRPVGYQVNHKSGRRDDNRIGNLEWSTCSENALHRARVLKSCTGERHPQRKLTAAQVAEIRSLLAGGATLLSAGCRFGVGTSTVSRIKNRQNWREV